MEAKYFLFNKLNFKIFILIHNDMKETFMANMFTCGDTFIMKLICENFFPFPQMLTNLLLWMK